MPISNKTSSDLYSIIQKTASNYASNISEVKNEDSKTLTDILSNAISEYVGIVTPNITEITGQFMGSSNTFNTLPIIDSSSNPISNGDWAILTADDGGNTSGIYAYNGSTYVFVIEIADSFVGASTIISPASTDSIGAVGTGTSYARDSHKHPAQGISTDAGNLLEVGSDGLHALKVEAVNSDSDSFVLASDKTRKHPDAFKVIPLSSAPVDGTTRAYFLGQLFWDYVNKKLYEATAKSTDPDNNGTGSTFLPVTDDGIETIRVDASVSAQNLVLVASTGANASFMYVLVDKTNSATVTVQSGESLNGVVDGVFTLSNFPVGSQFLVTSRSVGEWDIILLGSSTTIARREVSYNATEVTLVSGATTLVYNTDPIGGQISVYDGYYYDEGSVRHIFLPFASDEDALTTLELSSNLIPSGASIESFSFWTDDRNGGTTSEEWNLGIINGVGNQFYANRIDTGADRRFYTLHFIVKGVAQGSTVLAGMVPIEDLETIEYSEQAALTFGPTFSLDNSRTWNDLKNDYDYLIFNYSVKVTGVTERVLRTIQVKASQFGDLTNHRFEYGAAVVNLNPGIETGGDFIFSGSSVDNITLEIRGKKVQKTVVRTDDVPVNDQALSGYYDIGNMRIQWGQGVGGNVITGSVALPAPFANNSYSIVGTSNGNDLNTAHNIQIHTLTTTGFSYNKKFGEYTSTTNGAFPSGFSWQAIGLKP